MLATIAELLLKLLHNFNLQNMTIWLCEHDNSHFIMFRQVEVIRNGLPAAAELPLIADMSDPIDIESSPCRYIRRYVFTGLIVLGCANLISFYWQSDGKRWPYFDTPLILIHQMRLSKNIAVIDEQ